MRNIFIYFAALAVAAFTCVSASAADREWKEVPGGLPYYKYSGNHTEDPAILLGNSRIKVRTHLSGIYELISGERCWGLFNADPARAGYGKNRATVYVGKKVTQLVGPGSLATKHGKCDVYSGAGFTRYDYDLGEGIKCSRMISVMPADSLEHSNPLFLVTLTFTNEGTSAQRISYDEAISPNYVQSAYQYIPEAERTLKYALSTEISFRYIKASYLPIPQNYTMLSVPGDRAMEEVAPQSVFLYCDNAFLVVNEGELKASVNEFKLRPRKSHTFHIVIGFSSDDDKERTEKAIAMAEENPYGAFASMWRQRIPDFSSERNKDVRNELYRSAYSVEAASVYNAYFNETFMPADFQHAIKYGENLSNRDHIVAALHACVTRPDLAKSIIRYVMKQTSFDGMIPDRNKGFGYIPSDAFSYNLVQLEVMNVIAEYLKRTGDYAFLDEWLNIYPIEKGEMQTVKTLLGRYLIYLRSQIYTSNTMAVMQAAYLPRFVEQMEISGKMSDEYLKALKAYKDSALEKFNAQQYSGSSDLSYLMEVESLTTSAKRDLIDAAIDNGTVDMRSIPGIAAFDGIEASSLFRSLVIKNADSDNPDVTDVLTLYAFYRLFE